MAMPNGWNGGSEMACMTWAHEATRWIIRGNVEADAATAGDDEAGDVRLKLLRSPQTYPRTTTVELVSTGQNARRHARSSWPLAWAERQLTRGRKGQGQQLGRGAALAVAGARGTTSIHCSGARLLLAGCAVQRHCSSSSSSLISLPILAQTAVHAQDVGMVGMLRCLGMQAAV
ncbi:hypothetical protein E2562_019541 [Oryza meyeriana var. granulata]|uniref:Uncharacterized protein n=1 Tax=Oryza meyeriana var. granulata TaxID=110450 RepID=A0A6G1CGW1_9ORYZ|nr:hypothetical protein E2562_019541 [Oryza meyeriana var. granulata]